MDFERNPQDFPRFTRAFSDPEGLVAQWLEATAIIPLWAREWKCKERWRVGPRVLTDSMWFWFPRGSGIATMGEDQRSFRFQPGDLILVPKGTPHMVRLAPGSKTTHVSVHFHAYVYGSINLLDIVGFPFHVPASAGGPFERASNRAAQFFATKALGWSQVMASEILNVLIHILCHHGALFRAERLEKPRRELVRFLPALRVIEERLGDPELGVADLARAMSVSEVHFRKLFREMAGMNPVNFIQRRRIERACTQLRRTQMPIKEISETCGFADIVFFYRVFKHWAKTTPAEYRHAREV